MNLKVVSKTTKCRDFTVIFPFFQKCTVIFPIFYCDFLTALAIMLYTQTQVLLAFQSTHLTILQHNLLL